MSLQIIKNPDTESYESATEAVKENGGYCPCFLDKNADTKCPCKDFRERQTVGECHCGRFVKINDMTYDESIKVFDILDKFEFFGGQRAGRELWFNKPTDIQNKDIGEFLRDLDFLKQFINRQKAEIEELTTRNERQKYVIKVYQIKETRIEAIKEFAERLKEKLIKGGIYPVLVKNSINDLVKEMTEETI